MTGIGSLNEGPLHAALKEHYRRDGDLVEQPVDGFVADLLRGDRLIEIQTKGFSAMRRKFDLLLDAHPILLVHPVSAVRWIVKLDEDGQRVSRRRSPKRGILADICDELVSFPSLLTHPNFTVEVVLIEEEELRRPDVHKGWRKGGFVTAERRLVDIISTTRLTGPQDLLQLLPDRLPTPFTTADLASGLGRSRRQAQGVAYCLRHSGVAVIVDRNAKGNQYVLA